MQKTPAQHSLTGPPLQHVPPACLCCPPKPFAAARTATAPMVVFLFCLTLLTQLILTPSPAPATPKPLSMADNAIKKIFILHSYELSHICGDPQHKGVIRALSEAGFSASSTLDVQTYAMDTKRINNTPELIAEQAQIARKLIDKYAPDVLITLDDNAFRSVGLLYAKTNLPVVFSGMNVMPQKYNAEGWLDSMDYPGHNITGVFEKLHVISALRVQEKILGKLKNVLFLSDDSPTGIAVRAQVHQEMGAEKHAYKVEEFIAESWESYKEKVLQSCSANQFDTLYPAALLLKDAAGQTYTAPEILRWTIEHCPTPAIPLNFAFVELGMMGGAGVDFEYMGWQAGQLVVRILQGEQPATIPIQQAQRYALVFNTDRAKALGITIPDEILLAADELYPH